MIKVHRMLSSASNAAVFIALASVLSVYSSAQAQPVAAGGLLSQSVANGHETQSTGEGRVGIGSGTGKRPTGVPKLGGGNCAGSVSSFTPPIQSQDPKIAVSTAEILRPYAGGSILHAESAAVVASFNNNISISLDYDIAVTASLYSVDATAGVWSSPPVGSLVAQVSQEAGYLASVDVNVSTVPHSIYTLETAGFFALTNSFLGSDGNKYYWDPAGVCAAAGAVNCPVYHTDPNGVPYTPQRLISIGESNSMTCVDTTPPTVTAFVNNDTNTPATIVLGTSGNTTGAFNIYGSKLTANRDDLQPNITLTCPAGAPQTGTSVTCSGVTLNVLASSGAGADGQVNLTYTAMPTATIGSYQVTLTTWAGTTAVGTFSVVPQPQITFNGANIAGQTAIPVAVGQQVALSATVNVSGASGLTLSTQLWSWPTGDSAAAVGGYIACQQTGYVVPLAGTAPAGANTVCNQSATVQTADSADLTFYWVGQGTRTLMYTYTLSNGAIGSTTMMFNVTGPVSPGTPMIAVQSGQVQISPPNPPNQPFARVLPLGIPAPDGSGLQVGILFTAQATSASSTGGGYTWVQLLSLDVSRVRLANGLSTCGNLVNLALDNSYPYSVMYTVNNVANVSASDNPSLGLLTTTGEAVRAFTATMYLMWQAGTPQAIPVPLGSVDWQLNENAINTLVTLNAPPSNGSTWVVNSSCSQLAPGICVVAAPNAVPAAYPQWSAVSLNFTCNQ